MSNDLATEITERVKKLLDGLLVTRVWRRLSALPPLGQRLYTRYSDWVDGLLSRLYSPLTSALLFSRSSNLQFLPLSYAWFDRRWIDRRKRSRSFWRQSGREKDEDIIDQLQSTRPKPADDIILDLPTPRALSAENTEFTRAGQLAKKIALRLELLTNKGFHTPWRTSVEATGVPYYAGMAANDSLLDKVQGTIAGQRSSHLEETFYPYGPEDLSPPGHHPVSEQYIGAALMSIPGKFSLAERTATQAVYPFIPSSERMHLNFEPSGDLSARPSGQPVSQDQIGSLSHLFETPSTASNNTLVRSVFSRLQSLFGTPRVASSTNLMEEALADSPPYLFERPRAISDAVLAEKAGATPISLPEESPLFRRDEIPDMTGVDGRYFGNLVPQPPLDRTLGHGQPSPVHWSAGQIPSSLIGEVISQEMSGPAKAVASTIKNSSFGGYNRSTKVGLALAPIGRQRENVPTAPSSAVGTGQEGASEAADETMAALDPEALALEVYSILKRRLIVEKERTTSVVA